MWSQFDGEHVAGAARRRRERRLRAYLKYARMSVAMALAEARHHTAPRGQTTARAEATNDAPRSQTTSVVGDTEFFSLYEEELGNTRPDLTDLSLSAGAMLGSTVDTFSATVLWWLRTCFTHFLRDGGLES